MGMPPTESYRERVLAILAEHGAQPGSEICRLGRIWRPYAAQALEELVLAGAVVREGTGNKIRFRLPSTPTTVPRVFSRSCEPSPQAVSAPPPAEAPPDPVQRRNDQKAHTRLRQDNETLIEQLELERARAKVQERLAESAGDTRPFEVPSRSMGARDGTFVALASDWHFEETVDPESIGGVNEYNLDIAHRRAARFFTSMQGLLEQHRHMWRIPDVMLWLGGDLISGNIHDELVESNSLAPIEATLAVSAAIERGIHQLLRDPLLERLLIPCSYGNHGRITAKRRISTGAQNSFEWGMYHELRRRFAHDPRVTFIIPKSAHTYVKVYDQVVHFHHGDDVKYNGGTGGISIPLMKRIAQWQTIRASDLHVIGHYHQLRNFGSAIVNGSLIGYNAYAMSVGAGYEEPRQGSFMLDARRGVSMWTPLWVEDLAGTPEEAA